MTDKIQWAVVLDNAESYSEHEHIVAAVCDSEEDAEALCARFRSWFSEAPGWSSFLQRDHALFAQICDLHQKSAPIPLSTDQWEPFLNHKATAIPIPNWSQKESHE